MRMFADFGAIKVGDSERLVKTISEADIRRFVELTGDDNPLHVDPVFAATTSYKEVVVHGMLGASLLSAVIGTKLPGPGALWISQNLEFLLPVRLGDTLTILCTVVGKNVRERLLELDTRIANQNKQTVLSGTGKVKVLVQKAAQAAAVRSTGRVAIITGGSGGIGQAICRRLAQAGCRVVINYHGRKDLAERLAAEVNGGGEAMAIHADVSTQPGVESLVAATLKRFGTIDILVNNAAPKINPKKLDVLEWGDIQRHLDVQLKGAFLMSQSCIPHMLNHPHASIINITSQAIDGTPSATWTSYAIAKAGLAMFSRYLAVELGPSGIRVNCVSPGMTETSLIGDIPEKVQMVVARQTPLRRLAQPADVAAAVAYLVSEEASFVTGQTVRVNGGISFS